MNRLDEAQVVSRLKHLPALPSVMSELLASFDAEDVDIGHIAQQIARDQALAARVIRVANSSFYGLQSRVGTISEAVVVLGFRAVRSMVLAVGLNGWFRVESCPEFQTSAYVRHSLGVGLAARALANEVGINPDVAFTAGILHDIGELVLASCFPAQYQEALVYRRTEDAPLLAAEHAVLATDHARAGGLLAEAWHFPVQLLRAVRDHHAPSAGPSDSLVDLVHVADQIAHALNVSQSDSEMVMPVDEGAWQRLGVNADVLQRILPQVGEGMAEVSAFSG